MGRVRFDIFYLQGRLSCFVWINAIGCGAVSHWSWLMNWTWSHYLSWTEYLRRGFLRFTFAFDLHLGAVIGCLSHNYNRPITVQKWGSNANVNLKKQESPYLIYCQIYSTLVQNEPEMHRQWRFVTNTI